MFVDRSRQKLLGSQYMILLSIYDDIILNKVIYLTINKEPCFKFPILSY